MIMQSSRQRTCGTLTETQRSLPASARSQNYRVALAAATAERGGSDATTSAPQFVQQRECQTVAAHPDRMTQCDGAAVDVDPVEVDAELS